MRPDLGGGGGGGDGDQQDVKGEGSPRVCDRVENVISEMHRAGVGSNRQELTQVRSLPARI